MEACALERELRGGGVIRDSTREPPAQQEVDLEQWKKEVKRELRQELQEQLTALRRTLVELTEVPPMVKGEAIIKPQPPATVGHMDRAKTGPKKEEPQKEGVLGRCPQVEVGRRRFLSLLDTGSQVISEGTAPPSRSSWGVPVSPSVIPSRFRPAPKFCAGTKCRVAATWCCRPPCPER
ncbi:hypothetical protein SKAU_G00400290 [Synaphobranchus kaupii]|uniref:Uncharacterized protein n=1 Tax=Synaphobranchus kaupii TaxID=118154 RepID=A0A9Q1E8W5_SYNKA|nr:hypothetical protein SKAU_G00400290 [Synaphobranchus kaupii]